MNNEVMVKHMVFMFGKFFEFDSRQDADAFEKKTMSWWFSD